VHAKAGLGRYAGCLAQELVSRRPGRLALFYNGGRHSRLPAELEEVPARCVRAGYKPWRMAVWLGHLAGVGFDRLVPGAELFHATEHLLPPLHGIPTVLTVHDMIFRLYPQHQKPLNYWYLNATMPLYCRRADAIITVSESSRRDLVAHYRVDADKVHVIYEAAGPEFLCVEEERASEVRQKLGLPERYLVHVGTIEPRKNLTRLVDALQSLSDEGLSVPLVVVGSRGWLYDDFFGHLAGLGIRGSVFFPGYVAASDLPLVYAAATASITPSVYEGFGLPVLEAMACGTPVACSKISSLPEVAGDAALTFDPLDVRAIADSIRALWTDPLLRAELRERGLRQAARFSWARAAEETWAVYQSLLA
jgi:glycosyltransferase involved in cell wall biosynthesis